MKTCIHENIREQIYFERNKFICYFTTSFCIPCGSNFSSFVRLHWKYVWNNKFALKIYQIWLMRETAMGIPTTSRFDLPIPDTLSKKTWHHKSRNCKLIQIKQTWNLVLLCWWIACISWKNENDWIDIVLKRKD